MESSASGSAPSLVDFSSASPWEQHAPARRCAVVLPIIKSAGSASAGLLHEGIASSERRDVTGEILKATLGPPHLLEYMERCAGVDWNHGKELIGKCQRARWQMDAAQIRKSLGEEMVNVVTPAIWVQNGIHPLPSRLDMATPGQLECYRLAEARHPLFMSVYGKGIKGGRGTNSLGEEGEVVVPLVLNRIATTPEPANMDGYGHISIAKSLGDWQRELLEGDTTQRNGVARTPDELPPLVYYAPGVFDSLSEVVKSLEATGAVPTTGTRGGDALKTSGAVEEGSSKGRRCRKCKKECSESVRFCSSCGSSLFDPKASVSELSKALAPQARALIR